MAVACMKQFYVNYERSMSWLDCYPHHISTKKNTDEVALW